MDAAGNIAFNAENNQAQDELNPFSSKGGEVKVSDILSPVCQVILDSLSSRFRSAETSSTAEVCSGVSKPIVARSISNDSEAGCVVGDVLCTVPGAQVC